MHNYWSYGEIVSVPAYLTLEEVVERYRNQVSGGYATQLAIEENWSVIRQNRQSDPIPDRGAGAMGSFKPDFL